MASALSKIIDYQYTAKTYANTNGIQFTCGKQFVHVLDIKPGEKVLDMGCGTGELTSYIAYQVGEEGQVVGVDPDEERIKVAVEKHLNGRPSNLSFVAGDSSSHFPHFNEEYYDLHFSNFVFHWLTPEEKRIFFKAAMKCLKPGGRIAINSDEALHYLFEEVNNLFPDDQVEKERSPFQMMDKATAESIVKEAGFEIISSVYKKDSNTFPSADTFITWKCVSGFLDESKLVPEKKKAFAEKYENADGTIELNHTYYHIIARKPLF